MRVNIWNPSTQAGGQKCFFLWPALVLIPRIFAYIATLHSSHEGCWLLNNGENVQKNMVRKYARVKRCHFRSVNFPCALFVYPQTHTPATPPYSVQKEISILTDTHKTFLFWASPLKENKLISIQNECFIPFPFKELAPVSSINTCNMKGMIHSLSVKIKKLFPKFRAARIL